MRMRNLVVFAVLAAAFTAARPAAGAGISLGDFDAKAVGMSNAFAATADNASANFYNPAGIAQLDGLQGEATLLLIDPKTTYDAAPGQGSDETATRKWLFAPALFGSAEITDFLHLGLGGFVPFGLAVDWGGTWSGRYMVHNSEINVMEFNANAALKFVLSGDATLLLAGGASLIDGEALLQKSVDMSFLGAEDAIARLKVATNSNPCSRWNLASMLLLFERKLRLGFAYRDAIHDARLKGRTDFYNIPINPLSGLPALPRAVRAEAFAVLPNEFRGGIAFDPIESLTIELDYKFVNWSVVKRWKIENRGLPDSYLPFLWHDTSEVMLGVEYRPMKDFLAVRGGLYWDESPVNLKTLSPTVPDNDRLGFSFGLGLAPAKWVYVDLAYLAVYFKSVIKNNDRGADDVTGGNPRANGSYETWANLFTITVGIKF